MAFFNSVVVYINGVRFDPISVNYTAEDGGHYNFSVDVPAVSEWDILPERSHGAVFFTDPVIRKWRFLCEGEYVSVSKSKAGTGTRSRTLYFRSIFGWWSQANYVSMLSLTSAPKAGSQIAKDIILARAQGRNFSFEFDPSLDSTFRIESLQALITTATDGNASKSIPAFFPILLRNCALQTPVEAFYMSVRNLNNKIHAFPDKEIETILDIERYKDLIYNGLHSCDLKPTNSLEYMMRRYEDLAFYQRKVLPAPFQFDNKIMELMWTPQLYTVMPPVCNVIFDAQILMANEQRNLMSEPTRVTAQLQLPFVDGKGSALPFVYMANEVKAYNISAINSDKTAANPAVAVTHDWLSREEMVKGVIVTPVQLGIEKVINNKQTVSSPEFYSYVEEACRHQFFLEKAKARQASLTCVFMPYIAVGFPCIVEDKSGPYIGMVQSVTHTLNQTTPSTSVSLSYVRALYVQTGKQRSPENPKWLNKMFLPADIEKTYEDLLGIKPKNIGKSANPYRSYTSITQNKGTSDQDVAASAIIPVPQYTEDLRKISDGTQKDTVSSQLAKKPDAALAYCQFQYREGMTLTEFITFSNMDSSYVSDEIGLNNSGLPKDICPDDSSYFAYPNGLKFVGVGGGGNGTFEATGNIFGVYEVVGSLNSSRQTASRTIQEAILRRIAAH